MSLDEPFLSPLNSRLHLAEVGLDLLSYRMGEWPKGLHLAVKLALKERDPEDAVSNVLSYFSQIPPLDQSLFP